MHKIECDVCAGTGILTVLGRGEKRCPCCDGAGRIEVDYDPDLKADWDFELWRDER